MGKLSGAAYRGLIAGMVLCGVSAPAAGDGVRLYGGDRAVGFLSSVMSGTDSLDLLLVGDSNVGYDGGTTQRGFTGGFVDALLDAGADMYATAVCTAASDAATMPFYPCFGGAGEASMYQTMISVGAASGSGAAFVRGSTAWTDPSLPFYAGVAPGARLRATGTTTDWLLRTDPSESGGTLADWLGLARSARPHQLSSHMELVFRVGFARFPGSAGYVQPSVHRAPADGGAVIGAVSRFSAAASGPVPDIATAEIRISADAGRGAIRGRHAAYPMAGPVGVVFRSFYRPGLGFAVTPVAYNSGENTTQVASAVTAAGRGMVRSYLREVRERQRSAGGSGRVLVFTNSGVNRDTASTWNAGTASIVQSFRTAWSDLGYPASDLAFLVSVSAPTSQTDTMSALRYVGRAMAASQVDVAFADFGALGPTLFGGGLWDPRGSAHLSASGYRTVAAQMLTCPMTRIGDIDASGRVDGQDLAMLLAAWGAPGGMTDLNADGQVDGQDLAMLLASWGP